MELWNDYEGKVLDGQFCLEHLIGPKGRSAFFTTKDSGGAPATIRVIESLNDEEEILARWNAVRSIEEPHLLKILACNKTVLDGVHLVYAVLEPTDAELSDLLRERALTPEEARDVAASVVGALEALHARGLVHEHVDAESVFAQGEQVKLRGDCVREAPEGAEGETLQRRDAHDLAMLVGYALTQRRDSGQARLPRPFDDLVRNGMTGTWGLREMGAAVRPLAVSGGPVAGSRPATVNGAARGPEVMEKPVAVKAAASAEGPVAVPARQGGAAGTAVQTEGGVAPSLSASRPAIGTASGPAAGPAAGPANGPALATSPRAVAESLRGGAAAVPTRRSEPSDRIVVDEEGGRGRRPGVLAAVAAGAVLLVFLLWHFLHGSSSRPSTTGGGTVSSQSSGMSAATGLRPEASGTATAGAPVTTPTKPSAGTLQKGGRGRQSQPLVAQRASGPGAQAAVVHGVGAVGSQWRVVAFTYNREDQAQHKAEAIAQVHPELKPEVYTPSGRPPYLVALGGWMSADQAKALREKARNDGMPRDMYAQNFHAR